MILIIFKYTLIYRKYFFIKLSRSFIKSVMKQIKAKKKKRYINLTNQTEEWSPRHAPIAFAFAVEMIPNLPSYI